MVDKKGGAARAAKKAPSEAIVVRATGAALGKDDKALLSEALRRAESTRNVLEGELLDFGRWLLAEVFRDDAAAAIGERKRENPVWRELLARAGGPTLRLSDKILYVALEIAAHDKRIQDDSWRLLEPGRKELLLPLRDEALMRKAARRVVEMKLSHRAIRQLVRAELEGLGKPRSARVTTKRLEGQLKRFTDAVLDPAYRRRLELALREAPAEEKTRLRGEVTALRAWARDLLEKLR